MPNSKWIILVVVIASSFIGLVWYLGLYGFIMSLLWSLFLIVITNIDKAGDLIASSYKWGRTISFWFEKNAVEKRLESTIGIASKRVNEEAGVDLVPHGIDIKWVLPEKRDAFLKKGKMVVCLEPSVNEERNLARATLMYVEEDLIAPSQRFVNATIMRSLCFAVARKMLMLDKKLHALKCLNKEYIDPEIEKISQIRGYVTGMDNIDKQGFLTRILLKEFSTLDSKLSPALTDTESRSESKGFVRMLRQFVERKEDELVPLTFQGLRFRIHIMPVARLTRNFDVANYVKAASISFNQNIGTIYVVARGKNVVIAKLVISEIEKAKAYFKNKDWEYDIIGRVTGHLRCYLAELSRVP